MKSRIKIYTMLKCDHAETAFKIKHVVETNQDGKTRQTFSITERWRPATNAAQDPRRSAAVGSTRGAGPEQPTVSLDAAKP